MTYMPKYKGTATCNKGFILFITWHSLSRTACDIAVKKEYNGRFCLNNQWQNKIQNLKQRKKNIAFNWTLHYAVIYTPNLDLGVSSCWKIFKKAKNDHEYDMVLKRFIFNI